MWNGFSASPRTSCSVAGPRELAARLRGSRAQRCLMRNSTVALNAPSFPALTFGSLWSKAISQTTRQQLGRGRKHGNEKWKMGIGLELEVGNASGKRVGKLGKREREGGGRTRSPRTAKPWVQPSQYVRVYPGANLPSPRRSSACVWASGGNCWSIVHELISSGAFDSAAYFYEAAWVSLSSQTQHGGMACVCGAVMHAREARTWRSSGILRRDGCETATTSISPVNARSKPGRAP